MKEDNNKIKSISLFLIILLIIVACSSDKKDWQNAKQLNTIPLYEDFIKNHPESEFVDSANYLIEDIYFQNWQNAKQLDSIPVYEDYIKKYPESKFIDSVKHNIDRLIYINAAAKKPFSIENVLQFIYDYPENKFVENAKTILNQAKEILKWSILSVTQFDEYDRIAKVVLKNTDREDVAALNVEYSGLVIVKTNMIDLSNNKIIHTINYDEYGRPKNKKYLCLDFNGNIIKRDGNVVFVENFSSNQKSVTKYQYDGSFRIGETTRIYTCKDCSDELNILECWFIW